MMDYAQLVPDLPEEAQEQLSRLRPLYEEWNAAINVISRKDMDSFEERHVLHSLAIFNAMRFAPGSRVLDVGTGGGFPGIPLAIACPGCRIYLVRQHWQENESCPCEWFTHWDSKMSPCTTDVPRKLRVNLISL